MTHQGEQMALNLQERPKTKKKSVIQIVTHLFVTLSKLKIWFESSVRIRTLG